MYFFALLLQFSVQKRSLSFSGQSYRHFHFLPICPLYTFASMLTSLSFFLVCTIELVNEIKRLLTKDLDSQTVMVIILLSAVCHKVIPSGKLKNENHCLRVATIFAYGIFIAAIGSLHWRY